MFKTDAEAAGGFYPAADKDLFDMDIGHLNRQLGKPHRRHCRQSNSNHWCGWRTGSAMVELFETAGAEVVAVDINAEVSQARFFRKYS